MLRLPRRLNRTFLIILLLAVGMLAAAPALAQPCRVIATQPPAGASKVDPGLKAVRVSFSQPMMIDRWSFVKNPNLGRFPQLGGKPRFVDPKTCVLPVKLEPGVTYAVGVNTGGFSNFRPQAAPNKPCAPYQIIFTTAP